MERQAKNNRGLFITFEGPEGAGKSTQIKLLAAYLAGRRFDVLCTREPGGTPLAEKIRGVVKHDNVEYITPETELLLFTAARSQHVVNVIRPALTAGKIVLCDRFADSTTAYQGYARGMDMAMIAYLERIAVGDCCPDITFVIDLPVEEGFARTVHRAETAGNYDRFESQNVDFHRQVRAGFLRIAGENPERVKVIDGSRPPEEVQADIRSFCDALI